MTDSKITVCSFCGSHKDDVTKLIVGDSVSICSECVSLCNKLITDEIGMPIKKKPKPKTLNAMTIKAFLDDYVIGQTQAKIALSVAVTNHYKRIDNVSKSIELKKNNILMVGPTGTGKTILVKTLAKYLDVPCTIIDATNLTEAGYVGEDVETMLSSLLVLANYDVDKAEKGIVFIDEVDKIARKISSNASVKDISGEGVQQALLKILEGTKCKVPVVGKRKTTSETVELDTKNILFVAGGAFIGLDKIVNERLHRISMGFNAVSPVNSVSDTIISDDLIKYGMIPEFIGRFSSIVSLTTLTKDELLAILSSVNNNIIDQYKFLFSMDDITLSFTDEALSEITQRCIDSKMGARGLYTELERILTIHMFHIKLYNEKNINSLTIDLDQVHNPKILTLPK